MKEETTNRETTDEMATNQETRDEMTDQGDGKPLTTADMAGMPEQHYERRGRQDVAGTAPLLDGGDTQTFRSRWESIQSEFVDEPRQSVEQADTLVAEVMQTLAQTFNNQKGTLEEQWNRGQDASTEDLRLALQKYRSFFDRLLSL